MSGTAVEFPARDGYRLAGTLYRPASPNRRAVLIQAATGVRQEYYGKFAAYLAARGFSALTFDYRLRPGIVQSSNALALMRAIGLRV